jgi:hypothetical protein
MRLLLVGTILVLLGVQSMGQSSATPCSAEKATQNRARNKSNRSSPSDGKKPQKTGSSCEKTDNHAKSDAGDETFGWDPVTDWDGQNSGEIVGLFVFGLIVSAPIILIARRLKSRKSESEVASKILGIATLSG